MIDARTPFRRNPDVGGRIRELVVEVESRTVIDFITQAVLPEFGIDRVPVGNALIGTDPLDRSFGSSRGRRRFEAVPRAPGRRPHRQGGAVEASRHGRAGAVSPGMGPLPRVTALPGPMGRPRDPGPRRGDPDRSIDNVREPIAGAIRELREMTATDPDPPVGASREAGAAPCDDEMTITVTGDGPYIVTGGVPLRKAEICYDDKGFTRGYDETEIPVDRPTYALCRCGHTANPPFCDGAHGRVAFDGTETDDRQPFSEGARIIRGPSLTLADNDRLCIHVGFCHRAGGIWNLVKFSDPESRETAIEEACDCPTGRLVVFDSATGEEIVRDRERSIAVIEDPLTGEHGPLWVRGGIPVISDDGTPYEVRNRVTLCRCGRSKRMPLCDGSHLD